MNVLIVLSGKFLPVRNVSSVKDQLHTTSKIILSVMIISLVLTLLINSAVIKNKSAGFLGFLFTGVVKLNLLDGIRNFNDWISRTRQKYSRFMYALISVYCALFLAMYMQASIMVISLLLLASLFIPFSIVVMILTENSIYIFLKEKPWGKAIITVIITLYSAMAYIWASGEVNRIFVEAPGNFPWAISILTVVHFFKNIVLAVMGGYLAFLLFYVNFWVLDVLVISYKDLKSLFKRVVAGVMLIFGLGLSIGSSGFLTNNSDNLAKIVAVKADFNQHHSCSNPKLAAVAGVVFLPQGYVLAAKPLPMGGWSFEKVQCKS